MRFNQYIITILLKQYVNSVADTVCSYEQAVFSLHKVEGIVLTLADMRTNLARATIEALRNEYGSRLRIFNTQIPIAVKAAETSVAGQSIYSYDKGSKVAHAYSEFTKEVLKNGERTKAAVTISR